MRMCALKQLRKKCYCHAARLFKCGALDLRLLVVTVSPGASHNDDAELDGTAQRFLACAVCFFEVALRCF